MLFDVRSVNSNGRTKVVPRKSAFHVAESPRPRETSTRLLPVTWLPSIVTAWPPKSIVNVDSATVAGQSVKSGKVESFFGLVRGSRRGETSADTRKRSAVGRVPIRQCRPENPLRGCYAASFANALQYGAPDRLARHELREARVRFRAGELPPALDRDVELKKRISISTTSVASPQTIEVPGPCP